MADNKTERSNCRFTVKRTTDGKPFLAVELYHDTIPMLKDVLFGFDLLGGVRLEEAQKLADMLNERVLDMFVTTTCS
jgi:hypothetical protein